MTPEQQERVSELFEKARDLDPGEREAFVRDACDDEQIRAEVRSLLSAHDQAGTFMQEPVLASPHSPTPQERTPGAIGQVVLAKLSERYEILAELGRGGMGVVYRARDRETNVLVALKILKPEIAAEPREVERFKQEVRLARKVTHRNVCRTYELLRFDDTVVISMEYVDGESLRAILDRSSGVRLRRGLEWAVQICEALAAAHAQNVVHRDLKPENIFVDQSGQIKVMDFGIARSLEAEATRTGGPIGTPAYMSPEQAQGKAVDGRSDIYSLGLVLYETFTGRRAFEGDTPLVLLSKQITESPPPPREVEAYLPDFVDAALLKCMAKDPQQRFQSAKELHVALTERYVARPGRSRRLRAAVWGVLVLLGIVAASFSLGKWFWRATEPSYQRVTFHRGEIISARFHPDGTVVYSARWESEPPRLFATRPGSPESRPLDLGEFRVPRVLSLSRAGEMLLLDEDSRLAQAPFNGGAPRVLREDVEWADWASDRGKYALVYDSEGNDRLDFPAGKRLYETTGEITDLRVSPKANLIAFIEHPIQDDPRGWVGVVDLNGKGRALSAEYLDASGLAWSPRGEEIYFTAASAGHARALRAVTPAGKERLVLKTPGSLRLYDVSGDGSMLLELANQRGIVRGFFAGQTTERDLSWLDHSSASDLSDDGKLLLFDEEGEGGGPNHSVYLRSTGGSPAVRLGDGIAAALSPDGKWALSFRDTPPRRLVLLPTGPGESMVLPRGPIEKFYSAEWFGDGKHIVVTGSEPHRRIRCYMQDAEGGEPRPITPEGTYDLAVSPDGKFVVTLGAKKQVLCYPVGGGKPEPLPCLGPHEQVIRFSADGRYLYTYTVTDSLATVYRLELASGRREPVRVIKPPDPVVDRVDLVLLTPDGGSCVYNLLRAVSDLYVVDGLR
jgi:serine/threonine protein kinase/Tol biopolymer transport system component